MKKQAALDCDTIAYSFRLDLDSISVKLHCIHHDDMNTMMWYRNRHLTQTSELRVILLRIGCVSICTLNNRTALQFVWPANQTSAYYKSIRCLHVHSRLFVFYILDFILFCISLSCMFFFSFFFLCVQISWYELLFGVAPEIKVCSYNRRRNWPKQKNVSCVFHMHILKDMERERKCNAIKKTQELT